MSSYWDDDQNQNQNQEPMDDLQNDLNNSRGNRKNKSKSKSKNSSKGNSSPKSNSPNSKSSLNDKLEKANNKMDNLSDKVNNLSNKVSDFNKKSSKEISNDMKDGVKSGANKAKEGLNSAKDKAVDGLKNAPKNTKEGVKGGLQKAKDGINGALGKAKDGIKNGLHNAKENIKGGLNKVKNGFNKGVDAAKKVGKGIANGAKKGFNAAKNLPKNIVKGGKAIGRGIKAGINALRDIKGLSKKALNGLKNGGKALVNGLKNGLNGIKNMLNPKKMLNKLNPINAIKKRIEKAKKTLKKIKEAPKKAIKAVRDIPKKIKKALQTAKKAIKATIKAIKLAIKLMIKLIKLTIQLIKLAIKLIALLIKLLFALIQLIIAFWWVFAIIFVVGFILAGAYAFISDIVPQAREKTFRGEIQGGEGTNDFGLNEDKEIVQKSISSTNKAIELFYQYFSEKSLWVVYEGKVYDDDEIKDDTVYGGVTKPIQVNSKEYVNRFVDPDTEESILKDMYEREKMFIINPNMLFLLDKYLHQEQYRFPEQFCLHVPYKGSLFSNKYSLKHITDDDGEIQVKSTGHMFSGFTFEDGTFQFLWSPTDEKVDGVWDYGFGSILHYVKYIIKHEERGSYSSFETWDTTILEDERGLQTSGEHRHYDSYKEYELDPDKENHIVTEYANLQGDDRLVTYTADDIDEHPEKMHLADEDSYFIDWVVSPAGDITNKVVYNWKDSGKPWTETIIYEVEVPRMEETIETREEEQVATREQQSSNSTSYNCSSMITYYTKKVLPDYIRDEEGNILPAENDLTSYKTASWTCNLTADSKTYECNNLPLNSNSNTSNDNDTHVHDTSCSWECNHSCFLNLSCLLGCSHDEHTDDCKEYTCNEPLNYNSDTSNDNDAHVHTSACGYHYDHSGCEYGEKELDPITVEYVKKTEKTVTQQFTVLIKGTQWDRKPYYDGNPDMNNLTGDRYYKDYMTYYRTFIPESATGLFNLRDMLNRIGIREGGYLLMEELKELLEEENLSEVSSEIDNPYSLGEGSNRFEQLYNGSAKEVINQVWDGLIGWGYSPEQAAAVLGNIYNESTFNPNALNDSSNAYGLCQWLGGRYENLEQFAASQGKSASDLTVQIQYMCMELDATSNYPYATSQWISGGNLWQTSTDVSTLAMNMGLRWERFASVGDYEDGNPGVVKEINERQLDAQCAYLLLKDRVPTYSIPKIDPSKTGLKPTDDTTLKSTLNSVWGWIKGISKDKWEKLADFFMKKEAEDIFEDKYRIRWQKYLLTESEQEFVMASFFAYTEKKDTDTYYKKMDAEFYREHFATIFSNPVGNDWNIMANQGSSLMSFNTELIQKYFPTGFAKPLASCRISSLDSDYGVFLVSTDGENVYSSVSGTVYEIKTDDRYGGLYVMIDNGYSKTIIGGLKSVSVEVDATVNVGDIIGIANGEEIFFGIVNQDFVTVNPLFVLASMGDVNAKYPSFGPCTTMPIFKQYDSAIADYPYGTSTISRSGCGVCSFSMILSQIKGMEYSPIEVTEALNIVAAQRRENYTFYYIPGQGSTWACWGPLAEHYGLKFQETSDLSMNSIKSLLDQGYYVMMAIAGNGASPYGGDGHYIVVRGYDEYGFYVNDSNVGSGAYNPDIPYTYAELGAIKMIRGIGPSDASSPEVVQPGETDPNTPVNTEPVPPVNTDPNVSVEMTE